MVIAEKNMRWFCKVFTILVATTTILYASCRAPSQPMQKTCLTQKKASKCTTCTTDVCCARMGGISYCDSSAGRYVCQNGYYSSCYCTRHAIMDIQSIKGCCLWQGGVYAVNLQGVVICADGKISEVCSIQNTQNAHNSKISAF